MIAQTFENANGSVSTASVRPGYVSAGHLSAGHLSRWADRLRTLSVRVELDPYLAADIGCPSYDVPVGPNGLAQAVKRALRESRALAGEQGDAREIERCVRTYDAPVMAASWAQAIGPAFARSGWLRRGLDRLLSAVAANPLETIDRHIARDIGLELETTSVRTLRQGGL